MTKLVVGGDGLEDLPEEIKDAMREAGLGRLLGLGKKASGISTEKQLEALVEAAERYGSENHFSVGDLVTAREGYNLAHAGRLAIVVNKYEEPNWAFNVHESAGSAAYGRRLDMRVMTMVDDETIICFWVESWTYEFHPLNALHGK